MDKGDAGRPLEDRVFLRCDDAPCECGRKERLSRVLPLLPLGDRWDTELTGAVLFKEEALFFFAEELGVVAVDRGDWSSAVEQVAKTLEDCGG